MSKSFAKAGQFWLSSSHLRSISEQLLPNAVLFNNKLQKLYYGNTNIFEKAAKSMNLKLVYVQSCSNRYYDLSYIFQNIGL